MKKVLFCLLAMALFVSSNVHGQTLGNAKEMIQSLYQSKNVAGNPNESFATAKVLVEQYLQSVGSKVSRAGLAESYYEAMLMANDVENRAKVQENGFLYLLVGGKENLNIVYTALIDVYADAKDRAGIEWVLNGYKELSLNENGRHDADIAALEKEYDWILNPVRMEENVKGRWVAVDIVGKKSKTNLPFTILDIKGYEQEKNFLVTRSGYKIKKKKSGKTYLEPKFFNLGEPNIEPYNVGIDVDEPNKRMSMVFANQSLKRGNADLANKYQSQATRNFTRNQNLITSHIGKGTVGQVVGTTAANVASYGLMSMIAGNMAVSESTNSECIVTMNYVSPQLMKAHVFEINQYATTSGKTKENVLADNDTRLVKWEESDSVIFITEEGKPLFLGESIEKDSPLLQDYNKIKKKYSWTSPVNLGVFLGIEGALSWVTINGAMKMGGGPDKKFYYPRLVQFMVGMEAMMFTPYIFDSVLSNLRKKEYKKLNNEMTRKLRRKVNNASMSMYPTYNLDSNALGVGFTLNY